MKKEYEHKQRLGICMSRTKNKTNSLNFPNIDYFSRKVIGESRGVWDPPFDFDATALNACRCCVEFSDTGEWPENRPEDNLYCNWPSVNMDYFCTHRINGTSGLGHFNYTQTGTDNIKDILYMLDNWGKPFYPASCLTDPHCSWYPGGDPWPYWEDTTGSCCLPDGTCATTTPLVCGLHNGDFGTSPSCERKGSCCFQGGEGCEELTECECEKAEGSSWHDDGGDCGQGGGGNPCGSPAAPPDIGKGK